MSGCRDIASGIKRYIRDCRIRLKLIESDVINVSDNQWHYYKELNKCLTEYGKTHFLYYKYDTGKLEFSTLRNLLGVGERGAFRYLKRQRELFIEYISQKEIDLFAKYPFNDNARCNKVKEV